MRTSRGPLIVTFAALTACAFLVGAAGMGMRLPGLSLLPGIGSASALDYGRDSTLFKPLTPEFISRALGSGSSEGASSRGVIHRTGGPTNEAPSLNGRVEIEHELTNDDFEHAYRVTSIPFTARTDASDAQRQASEPSGCAPVGGGTIWYRYRAKRSLGLIANTIGTRQATSLAVFTGDGFGALQQVDGACHTSVRGNAYVTFPAKTGTTYHFQITGVADTGPSVFNLDPHGTTEMVSEGGLTSGWHSISADGRYVAFASPDPDLVDGDTNGVEDMFVRDLETGAIERVSVHSDGTEGNHESKPWKSAISGDGRYVAFTSMASNLVFGDTNDAEDVFVHDRVAGETTRVSVSSNGEQAVMPMAGAGDPSNTGSKAAQEPFADYNKSASVSISADGRYVVFDSDLTGLVGNDGPGTDYELGDAGRDVFMHDRRTGRTTLVSESAAGANGDAMSWFAQISADGRSVTFTSNAANLLAEAPLGADPWTGPLTRSHVYLRDMRSGSVDLVSVTPGGDPGNDKSIGSAVSADGRYVAFYSLASDLVAEDRNGALLDVFVRDRLLGRTEIASLTSSGEQAFEGRPYERTNVSTTPPTISWDGRYVAFHSDAAFVPGDTDESENLGGRVPICDIQNADVFLRDRLTGTTTRVSDSSKGNKGNGASSTPVMSADGRRIAFVSVAENLAPDRPSQVPMSCFESMDVFVHTFPVLR